MKKLHSWFLCFLSAVLLILAFPWVDAGFLAWFGLIPLMFALDGKKSWAAFRSAYLCGFLFFLGTLYWFFNVTRWFSWIAGLGVTLLLLYFALYFGLFGIAYSFFSRRKTIFRLFLLPSAWVALEFIRAHLFTGFDWASLGHSQYKNLTVIQIADLTGVFGVSFIVVMVNVLIKEGITAFYFRRTQEARRVLFFPILLTAMMVFVVLGYGIFRFSGAHQASPEILVATVQANIPQEIKWDRPVDNSVVTAHIALSEQALKHDPALIIWPETSCPDYLWDERENFDQIQAFVKRIGIPLLFGSVLKEGNDYYNAAILLSKEGEVAGIYRKSHLVPFGEFLPLRRFVPFLAEFLGMGDFTRGRERTVFTIFNRGGLQEVSSQGTFSVLICFEDTVARLSRESTMQGAQMLVNITNDAWFGKTKAPFMHMQSSMFRAVENRRGLVRAANTGVSCAIDPWGRIMKSAQGTVGPQRKGAYVSGYTIAQVPFSEKETFYTKFGDVFAILCFGCILVGIVGRKNKY